MVQSGGKGHVQDVVKQLMLRLKTANDWLVSCARICLTSFLLHKQLLTSPRGLCPSLSQKPARPFSCFSLSYTQPPACLESEAFHEYQSIEIFLCMQDLQITTAKSCSAATDCLEDSHGHPPTHARM